MQDQIQQLSDRQAPLAVRFFYELSPPEAWEGGRKPGPERVRTVVAALREQAPAGIQPVVEALADDSESAGAQARAAICRDLLESLSRQPELKPFVEQAVIKAREVHMAIDPVTGIFLIALLIASADVDKDGWHPGAGIARIISALNPAEMLNRLPAVIKALPAEVIAKLLGKAGLA
ncbi:MAG TPA: hypothetical protein VMT86_05575 [Bryobacteraceae bacterium]|nr:hypothetical protein [Bryobacteraceae bacterium]